MTDARVALLASLLAVMTLAANAQTYVASGGPAPVAPPAVNNLPYLPYAIIVQNSPGSYAVLDDVGHTPQGFLQGVTVSNDGSTLYVNFNRTYTEAPACQIGGDETLFGAFGASVHAGQILVKGRTLSDQWINWNTIDFNVGGRGNLVVTCQGGSW